MRLYNTMSRQVEDFVPLNPPEVKLYACGFTVYDYTHLGHLRKYTMDDILVRTLEHHGFEVKFVQNVTDVGHLTSDADTGEDKLEKGAKKYGKTVWDIAREFEDYFWYSMDLMGNKRPDISSRATEHIEAQLDLVKTLEEKGYTYEIPGDGIYFDTAKLADYGQLARLNPAGQQEGARIGVVEGKRQTTDFALWKFERAGENRTMVWPSPWHERSFPGWHVECSAMAMQYLGEQLDIHTGGIDHIPVHHPNEIAQSEAATGKKPFVRYWVHHNFLLVEGEKMSKSLGNFFTVDDVINRGFDPRALRLLFLTSHYRGEMNFTWENLAGMQKSYERLLRQIKELDEASTDLPPAGVSQMSEPARELHDQFFAAMNDDLNTPEAVAVMWQTLKTAMPAQEKLALLRVFDSILQLDLANLDAHLTETEIDPAQLPEAARQLLTERQQAREKGDWDQADSLRNQLKKMGYEIADTSTGQKISQITT